MLLRMYDLVPVGVEPVTVAQVKAAARIDGPDFDLLLPANISAARQLAEHQANRLFAERTVRFELSDWPDEALCIVPAGVVAVSYWDGAAWQTLATSQYVPVWSSTGVELQAPTGVVWPTLGDVPGPRVRVDVQVPADLPPSAAAYIVAQAAFWTNNPEAAQDRKQEPSPFLHHLLDAVRVYA